MAPQLEWPMTAINFAPEALQVNSRLPRISSFKMLPATRALKTSPMPWSKMSSLDWRESRQLKITANGCWPAALALTCAWRLRDRDWPATKRALPSRNSASACLGVIAACDSLVCTDENELASAEVCEV